MTTHRSRWYRTLVSALATAPLLCLAALPVDAQSSGDAAKERRVEKKRLSNGEKQRRVVVVRDGETGDRPGPLFYTRMLHGGYLGVEITALTPELREHFGAPRGHGVLIARVSEDSPAAKAGLAVGDIITEVDGEAIEGGWDLGVAVRAHGAGEEVDLEVWRDGSRMDFRVAVEERQRDQLNVESMYRFAPSPGDEPRVFRWKGGGDEREIVIDGEGLHELRESLDAVDWPLLEGRLLTDRNRELEKRLKTLEKRLAELEKALRDSERP